MSAISSGHVVVIGVRIGSLVCAEVRTGHLVVLGVRNK